MSSTKYTDTFDKKSSTLSMKYIDTHAHYTSRRFNKDRDSVIRRLLTSSVDKIIECGTNTWSNREVITLAEKYENVYATIGYFPCDAHELENDPSLLSALEDQLQHHKVVGIGEIGLDYYHPGNPAVQKQWFVDQLELAKKLGLPVCIHSRDAEQDTIDILKNNGPYIGVIHCYAYSPETMEVLAALGYYFGVGGTCTYSKNEDLREAIKRMPLERIVLETDCPYLSPKTRKRERNDSGNIPEVISEIAKLKGVSEEDVIRITNENVKKLYPKFFAKKGDNRNDIYC